MEASEIERIAAGYVAYVESLARTSHTDDAEVHVGESEFAEVKQSIHAGPADVAWALVLEVLRHAPDDRLDVYAAGPLEDLVCRWGVDLVTQIEAEAAHDDRFRRALARIWLLIGDLPSEELARIVHASGDETTPLNDHGIIKLIERAI